MKHVVFYQSLQEMVFSAGQVVDSMKQMTTQILSSLSKSRCFNILAFMNDCNNQSLPLTVLHAMRNVNNTNGRYMTKSPLTKDLALYARVSRMKEAWLHLAQPNVYIMVTWKSGRSSPLGDGSLNLISVTSMFCGIYATFVDAHLRALMFLLWIEVCESIGLKFRRCERIDSLRLSRLKRVQVAVSPVLAARLGSALRWNKGSNHGSQYQPQTSLLGVYQRNRGNSKINILAKPKQQINCHPLLSSIDSYQEQRPKDSNEPCLLLKLVMN